MIVPQSLCPSLLLDKAGDTKKKELLEGRNTKSHCTDQDAQTHRLRQSHIYCLQALCVKWCARKPYGFKRAIMRDSSYNLTG